MAFVPLPDGFKVEIIGAMGGEEAVNVLYFTKPSVNIPIDCELLADQMDSAIATALQPILASTVTLNNVIVTDVNVQNGFQVQHPRIPPEIGGDPGTHMPGNVAIVSSYRTGFSGRSFRGRSYWWGLVNSRISGNDVLAGTITSIQNWVAEFRTQAALVGFTHVVASFEANGAPRILGVPTPITSFSVDPRIKTQRRRVNEQGLP